MNIHYELNGTGHIYALTKMMMILANTTIPHLSICQVKQTGRGTKFKERNHRQSNKNINIGLQFLVNSLSYEKRRFSRFSYESATLFSEKRSFHEKHNAFHHAKL